MGGTRDRALLLEPSHGRDIHDCDAKWPTQTGGPSSAAPPVQSRFSHGRTTLELIELFLPIDRGDGSEVTLDDLARILAELTNRFGGATAFTRALAAGLWQQGRSIEHDRIVIIEVMVKTLDRGWWEHYRRTLEIEFHQERVLIRASRCTVL